MLLILIFQEIWENRPSLPKEKIFVLDKTYSGEDFKDKITRVREEMKKEGADVHIITSLDDIAWLFNIRGRDIPCTPVVLSYSYITEKEVMLFIDKDKLTKETEEYFFENDIEIKDYFDFYEFLKKSKENKKILLDYSRINSSVFNSIPKGIIKINKINPTQLFKAIKNKTENKKYNRSSY